MTYYTLTYVKGVVRCDDLEAMLFATQHLETITEEDPTEVFDEDDYDQDYEDHLDYLDHVTQSYD